MLATGSKGAWTMAATGPNEPLYPDLEPERIGTIWLDAERR